MTESGNVGIGTTNPNYPLSFGSNLANTKLAIWDGGANGVAFGLGVQGGQFRFHLNQASDRFSFLNGANGTELVTISGNGDVALLGKHALRASDNWLRLNQDGAFSAGVHTPGNFAPVALNVGGMGRWGNPGPGNVWIAGNVGIGTAGPEKTLHVAGLVKINGLLGVNGYDADAKPSDLGGGLSCLDVIYYGGIYNRSTVREKGELATFVQRTGQNRAAQPRSLRWAKAGTPGASHIGFIAEEVNEVFPECVVPDDTSESGFFALGINESALHSVAIAGVRELAYKFKALKEGLSVSRTGNVAIGSDSHCQTERCMWQAMSDWIAQHPILLPLAKQCCQTALKDSWCSTSTARATRSLTTKMTGVFDDQNTQGTHDRDPE